MDELKAALFRIETLERENCIYLKALLKMAGKMSVTQEHIREAVEVDVADLWREHDSIVSPDTKGDT